VRSHTAVEDVQRATARGTNLNAVVKFATSTAASIGPKMGTKTSNTDHTSATNEGTPEGKEGRRGKKVSQQSC
jgi:hypothetical protein